MSPRKRSSTAADGNAPSKRARSSSSDNAGSNEGTASSIASKSAAVVPPRPERFSEISATANAWKIWREFIAKDPDYAYSFMCLCELPHEQDDYDSEDQEEEEEEEEEAEESEGDECPGEGKRPRCSRGKACLCHRSVANRPNHKISVSCAGYKLLALQMSLAAVRCPDNFGMYTYNDHAAYGLVEVVENVFADFELFKDSWRDRWALCEAIVMFLSGPGAAEMFMYVADIYWAPLTDIPSGFHAFLCSVPNGDAGYPTLDSSIKCSIFSAACSSQCFTISSARMCCPPLAQSRTWASLWAFTYSSLRASTATTVFLKRMTKSLLVIVTGSMAPSPPTRGNTTSRLKTSTSLGMMAQMRMMVV